MDKATTGCATKIGIVDFENISEESGDDTLYRNNVEVETFITNVESHLNKFDLLMVFYRVSSFGRAFVR